MPIEYELPHAQARAYLHTGRRHLNGGAAKQLDAHLAGCPACRAYADYLAQAEPALTAALRAQWDPAQPPHSERAFAEGVRARVARPQRTLPTWLSGAGVTLTVGAALLVLVVVWISSGWGVSTGGPQPTEVVIEAIPHQATTAPLFEGLSGEILFSGTSGPATDTQWGLYALPPEGGPLTALTPYAQQTYGGVWSPDGQWIAFIGREFCCTQVFVMRADGSDLHRVSPASDTNWEYLQPISWSPDGQALAVSRMLPGDLALSIVNGEIILIPLDGSGARPFGPGLSPKWSPDGTRIAYIRTGISGPLLFTARLDGTDERQASDLRLYGNESNAFDWSPDSSALALIGLSIRSELELRQVRLEDDSQQVLANLDADENASRHLHWSPTGAYLLFDANLPIMKGAPRPLASLYLFSFATQQVALALPEVTGDFSWSPDGRHFLAADAGGANLYEFSIDVNDAPMLMHTVPVPDIWIYDPQWRPDPAVAATLPSPSPEATAVPSPNLPADLLDRWVAFVTRTTGQHDEVYVMRTDGRDGQRLTGLPATLGYDHSLSWSPDGTRLAFVSDRSGHPEVYVAEAGVWTAKPLTELTLLPGETTPTDYDLAWSPNGQLLAVTVYGARAPMDNWIGGDVYLISAELERQPFPTQAPRLARGLLNAAVWSPDGTRLAYIGYDDQTLPAVFMVEVPVEAIATHPVLNLNVQQITPSAAASDAPHDVYLGLAWSPDSTQLAYLRQGPWVGTYAQAQTGEGFHSSVEVINLAHLEAGSASVPPTGLFDLSPSPNGIMGLSWSPDGQYLLYLSDSVTAASLGNGTASTGCWTPRLLPLTTALPIQASGPAVALDGVCYLTRTALPQWSPDSRYLLFTAEAGLVTVNVPQALADGGHVQPLFLPLPADLPGLAHSPTWQPGP